MRIATILATSLIGALPLGMGCAQNRPPPADDIPFYPGERRGDVTLYRDMQFEDIPIPEYYTLLRTASHSFQSSRFRTGVFHYEGPVDWREAIAFFRTQAPASGWEFADYESGQDFRLMRFRKGPEQLLVVVRALHDGSRAEIQLDNIEHNDLLLKGRLATGGRGAP